MFRAVQAEDQEQVRGGEGGNRRTADGYRPETRPEGLGVEGENGEFRRKPPVNLNAHSPIVAHVFKVIIDVRNLLPVIDRSEQFVDLQNIRFMNEDVQVAELPEG